MALITEAYLRSRLVKGLPDPFPVRVGDKLTPAAVDFLKSRGIATCQIAPHPTILPDKMALKDMSVPVGVSNRHVHLSPEHVETLFGSGYSLTPMRELSQSGQFAAHETVILIGPKGIIRNVRILGPSRGATQVEVSRTDGYVLGVHPPVRLSGHIEDTPGITLAGTKGTVVLLQGLIVAKSHVHMSPQDASKMKAESGDRLILQTLGERPLIFADVIARVNERFSLDFHIDTDEANAAGLKTGDVVRMIGKNGEITGSVRG
ncbi:phosphate propanoyltransferase [Paenibacillus sedimenti]|uniref:Phosphate propanoyltransferase n=1 Tax=Paenibacillus sedimenti TaxID=2770274 RepID=A0A926KQG1_9BACL|nr:phosphate propanoyltransferase [Paenibacillus sedimenti]MBD0380195.1 phosphate propanoyltransferase [Paenibacillus sedimenti]